MNDVDELLVSVALCSCWLHGKNWAQLGHRKNENVERVVRLLSRGNILEVIRQETLVNLPAMIIECPVATIEKMREVR